MNLEELMQNGEFTEKLEKAKDLDEVVAMIKEEGVEITIEELRAAIEQNDEGELDEDKLEAVSGGSMVSWGLKQLIEWLRKHPHLRPFII